MPVTNKIGAYFGKLEIVSAAAPPQKVKSVPRWNDHSADEKLTIHGGGHVKKYNCKNLIDFGSTLQCKLRCIQCVSRIIVRKHGNAQDSTLGAVYDRTRFTKQVEML